MMVLFICQDSTRPFTGMTINNMIGEAVQILVRYRLPSLSVTATNVSSFLVCFNGSSLGWYIPYSMQKRRATFHCTDNIASLYIIIVYYFALFSLWNFPMLSLAIYNLWHLVTPLKGRAGCRIVIIPLFLLVRGGV